MTICAAYRSFNHVERLVGSCVDTAAYLDSDSIYIFDKLDGSNACIWAADGEVHCGSRKREVTLADDNANFCRYISETGGEVAALREFVLAHGNLVVYGEYLAHVPQQKRFIGSIKNYLEGGFFIFAVFDVEKGAYLPYAEYAAMLEGVYSKVLEPIAVLDHPTCDEVAAYTEKAAYNLPDGAIGEGIVVYNYGYRDEWKRSQVCKVVRAEFRESKSKSKKVYEDVDFEQEFVDTYCTAAFLDKCRNKVCQVCGVEEFNHRDKQQMGRFFTLVTFDLLDENLVDFIKKRKFPTLNFNTIKSTAVVEARKFLGLM